MSNLFAGILCIIYVLDDPSLHILNSMANYSQKPPSAFRQALARCLQSCRNDEANNVEGMCLVRHSLTLQLKKTTTTPIEKQKSQTPKIVLPSISKFMKWNVQKTNIYNYRLPTTNYVTWLLFVMRIDLLVWASHITGQHELC